MEKLEIAQISNNGKCLNNYSKYIPKVITLSFKMFSRDLVFSLKNNIIFFSYNYAGALDFKEENHKDKVPFL
jgi:hypothetical protein